MIDQHEREPVAVPNSGAGHFDEWLAIAGSMVSDREAAAHASMEDPIEQSDLEHRMARARRCLALINDAWSEADETIDESIGDDGPRQLGRFEILRRLGAGAHAIVYLARDPVLNRNVALKVPRPELIESDDLQRRFARESETMAGLAHPNLVPVYDLGFAGPVCFIAQAYVEGPSLHDHVAEHGPLWAELAACITAEIARAVAYIHRRRIIHRDIKPGNILLDAADPAAGSARVALDFTPKLTDFGLAKLLEPSQRLTQSQAVIGTPAYMAPEQVDGRVDQIGAATDVYGLGATLYEMLTGQSPFLADSTWETLRRIQDSDLVPPRKLNFLIPHDLEAICLKCLEFEPAHRYPTADDLADDLERFLRGEPVRARPPHPWERVAKWARKKPLAAALSLLLAISIIVGFSVVTWQWQQTRKQRDRAAANYRIAHQGLRELQELAITDKRFSHHLFDDLRRSLTESARRYARQLREQNKGNLQVDWDIADMGYQLAHASLASGDYEAAVEFCNSCIPEWERLANGSGNQVDAQYYLAKTHRILGNALRATGVEFDECMQQMNISADILESLIATHPQNPDLKNALAETYITAGSMCQFDGDFEQALRYSEEALELRRTAFRSAPGDRLLQRQLAEAHYRKAARLFALGDFSRLEDECLQALELLERLHEQEYSQPTTGIYVARCYRLRAGAAERAGTSGLAAEFHAAEQATLTELAGKYPQHEQVAKLLRDSQQQSLRKQETSSVSPMTGSRLDN